MSRTFAALLVLAAAALADSTTSPYPAGSSTQTIEDLETALALPATLPRDRTLSLVLLLHGNGDTGANLIRVLRDWPRDGYVVCAPSAPPKTWSPQLVAAAERIALHLIDVLPIDRAKVHCIGFSNGGWNLDPVAFSDDLKPCSATWVAAGCRSGSAPRWARKGLGVLALAGEQDANARAARETVGLLADKVRSVEVRLQPDLGHKWPSMHDAYLKWWAGTREGRFTPGDDMNFDWGGSVDAAVEALRGEKKGGILVYYFDAEKDREKQDACALQNDVFMDLEVRHYGNQLKAVKLAWTPDNPHGVKATPAVVVLDREGKPRKVLTGKIKERALASALRSVAPNRRKPD
jgi:predicted esterase